MKWNQVHDDDDGSREDPRGACTSYCPADDEGSGGGSSPAYCRADFKQDDGVDEDPFRVVEGVDAAHEELKGATSKHVGAGVPSDVIEGMEFVRDCRDGGCDDCTVLMNH